MADVGRELELFVELVSAYVKRGILSPEDLLGLAEQVMVKAKAVEPPRPPPRPGELACSFCAKPHEEVGRLVAGPDVHICDECIRLCSDIIEEQALEPPKVRA